MNSKLKQKLKMILRNHQNDKTPPKYVKSIKELLQLEKGKEG